MSSLLCQLTTSTVESLKQFLDAQVRTFSFIDTRPYFINTWTWTAGTYSLLIGPKGPPCSMNIPKATTDVNVEHNMFNIMKTQHHIVPLYTTVSSGIPIFSILNVLKCFRLDGCSMLLIKHRDFASDALLI